MQVGLNCPLQIELLPRGRVFTRVLPVPGTSVSSEQHPYRAPYKELLWVLYIHARTRNFCKICTPVPQYSGYGYSIFIPARNFCEFCTHVPQYPELLEVLQDFHARTRNLCELCTTFMPVPGTSVSFVRPVPQCPGYWCQLETSAV